jgi:glutamate-1-semialdehyde 2,1-aminomutase
MDAILEKTELSPYIPGGVNSPARAMKSVLDKPLLFSQAKGSLLIDVEGQEYIDFCASWGALILGHSPPCVMDIVKNQLDKGTTLGFTTPIEGLIAEKICTLVPSIESIRFVSSGTEATMSAVRLARAVTGRDKILKFTGGYHGHADLFLSDAGSNLMHFSSTPSSKGVPEGVVKDVISLPYNDLEIVRTFLQENRVAAVIIEPIAGNMGVIPAHKSFLEMLREETIAQGALLIFDEVISGFRVGLNSAQGLYDIIPDLTCLGKIVGGGFPAAAFGGKKWLMHHLAPVGEVFQAGTLSGNPIAMLAGYLTLQELEKESFYEDLHEKTARFLEPIAAHIQSKGLDVALQHVGSMFTLFFGTTSVQNFEDTKKLDLKKYKDFFQKLLAKGIFIPPSQYEAWFISAAHTSAELQYVQREIIALL